MHGGALGPQATGAHVELFRQRGARQCLIAATWTTRACKANIRNVHVIHRVLAYLWLWDKLRRFSEEDTHRKTLVAFDVCSTSNLLLEAVKRLAHLVNFAKNDSTLRNRSVGEGLDKLVKGDL